MTLLMLRLHSCFHEVVALRSIGFVGTDDDCLAILDKGLVAIEPVSTRTQESFEAQRATAIEPLGLKHHMLHGSGKLPGIVGGVVIVGGDENLKFILLRGFEDSLDVLDGLIVLDLVKNYDFQGSGAR